LRAVAHEIIANDRVGGFGAGRGLWPTIVKAIVARSLLRLSVVIAKDLWTAMPRTESPASLISAMTVDRNTHQGLELVMANEKGPNIKKKQKCKNCEGKGLLKKGDKVVKCQRCGGTGVR
jgi:hypothetical protein